MGYDRVSNIFAVLGGRVTRAGRRGLEVGHVNFSDHKGGGANGGCRIERGAIEGWLTSFGGTCCLKIESEAVAPVQGGGLFVCTRLEPNWNPIGTRSRRLAAVLSL